MVYLSKAIGRPFFSGFISAQIVIKMFLIYQATLPIDPWAISY